MIDSSHPIMNILNVTCHLFFVGACLHHQLFEKGNAQFVWKGEEERGTDRPPARDLSAAAEGASHLTWRFP